jgi:Pyruvate/2-oxoglutarate dehydrogenase complex, dehydrogenase (E1) component, eukaryotic type, beta subunit
VVREGGDITIVTLGRMVHTSLERPGSSPRTGSVRGRRPARPPARWTRTPCWRASRAPAGWSWSTRRIPGATIATDISALVARKAFGSLRAPIEMVTAPHTPVPFSNALEDIYIPDAQRVVNAVKTVTGWSR